MTEKSSTVLTVTAASAALPSPASFEPLKAALIGKAALLEAIICKRFRSPKPWKFIRSDYPISDSEETIDLVFGYPDGEDNR